MGKSRPQAPPTPNPSDLIAADAAANRITQFTPYGNLLFGSVGDQGQFVQGQVPEGGSAAAFTQETPFQSDLRALQENLGVGLATEAGQQFDQLAAQTPFDFTQGLPEYSFQDATNLPALPTDFEDTRKQVTQSVFDRQLGLLQPQFTKQKEDLAQNLANRGIPVGSEAYNSATNRLDTQQSEQTQRLAQAADVAGGAEASRTFGLTMQARNQAIADQLRANDLSNMARQAQLNERIGLRGQGFNELAALLGGPQIQQPTFFAPSAVNTLGANQLAMSGANNAFNQGMNTYSSGLGGLFDLAGSLGSAYILR
tara:strand:- start:261 stop:1196 length:936 start_codon:yes stop_codon:yes gene_type:complete